MVTLFPPTELQLVVQSSVWKLEEKEKEKKRERYLQLGVMFTFAMLHNLSSLQTEARLVKENIFHNCTNVGCYLKPWSTWPTSDPHLYGKKNVLECFHYTVLFAHHNYREAAERELMYFCTIKEKNLNRV